MDDDFEDRRWPLHVVSDEDWSYFAPSEGGKALRAGVEWLLDGDLTRTVGQPRTWMDALDALHSMERALEVERALLITQARTEGASWTDIARRVGLTKQAVHHRYREHTDRLTELIMGDGYSDDSLLDYVDAHFDAW